MHGLRVGQAFFHYQLTTINTSLILIKGFKLTLRVGHGQDGIVDMMWKGGLLQLSGTSMTLLMMDMNLMMADFSKYGRFSKDRMTILMKSFGMLGETPPTITMSLVQIVRISKIRSTLMKTLWSQ